MSCLFAKTKITAFSMNGSLMMAWKREEGQEENVGQKKFTEVDK
jgi:hypothetical protein